MLGKRIMLIKAQLCPEMIDCYINPDRILTAIPFEEDGVDKVDISLIDNKHRYIIEREDFDKILFDCGG